MAVSTLVETVAAETANTYVTLAEANQYFEDRPGSTLWSSATTDQKTQALLAACMDIDKLEFLYEIYDQSTPQALQFPRTASTIMNNRHQLTDSSGDPIIPTDIKRAQMEQAYHRLRLGSAEIEDMAAKGIVSKSIGDTSVSYSESLITAGAGATIGSMAASFLRSWINRVREVRRG